MKLVKASLHLVLETNKIMHIPFYNKPGIAFAFLQETEIQSNYGEFSV